MDDEAVARVSTARFSNLRSLAKLLQQSGIRTYEADISPARQYLMNRCLYGAIRVEGPWSPGSGVDRIYENPAFTPATRRTPDVPNRLRALRG